jgi:hypothetical protein
MLVSRKAPDLRDCKSEGSPFLHTNAWILLAVGQGRPTACNPPPNRGTLLCNKLTRLLSFAGAHLENLGKMSIIILITFLLPSR